MSKPSDDEIPAGELHRALRDVELRRHDYEQGNVETRLLPAGSIFQPWEPREHWRGVGVPITLGGDHAEFDWGVTSPAGHFLAWDDFLLKCGPEAEHSEWFRPPEPPLPHSRPCDRLFHRDAFGRTPLFLAAAAGSQEEVEALLAELPGTGFYPQRLGLIELTDHEGLTAADLAEKCGEHEMAELLRYKAWAMGTFG